MASKSPPDISIVVPVHDEEGAAAALAMEIAAAFEGAAHEIIFVDDASRDGTRAALTALKDRLPQLRVLAHAGNAGQSRALRTGILAATATVIGTAITDSSVSMAPAQVTGEVNPVSGPAPACQ